MLLGQYSSNLSKKRRVAIPKKFREILGARFIVTKWYEGSLVLVSMDSWNKLLSRVIKETELVIEPVRDTERFLLGSAYELVPDDQGRVIIPETLAMYAVLTESVRFVGLGDRVELWSGDKWEKREKYLNENANKILEELSRKGRE